MLWDILLVVNMFCLLFVKRVCVKIIFDIFFILIVEVLILFDEFFCKFFEEVCIWKSFDFFFNLEDVLRVEFLRRVNFDVIFDFKLIEVCIRIRVVDS